MGRQQIVELSQVSHLFNLTSSPSFYKREATGCQLKNCVIFFFVLVLRKRLALSQFELLWILLLYFILSFSSTSSIIFSVKIQIATLKTSGFPHLNLSLRKTALSVFILAPDVSFGFRVHGYEEIKSTTALHSTVLNHLQAKLKLLAINLIERQQAFKSSVITLLKHKVSDWICSPSGINEPTD